VCQGNEPAEPGGDHLDQPFGLEEGFEVESASGTVRYLMSKITPKDLFDALALLEADPGKGHHTASTCPFKACPGPHALEPGARCDWSRELFRSRVPLRQERFRDHRGEHRGHRKRIAIINGVSGGRGGTGVTGVESEVSGGRPHQPAGLRAFW